jgi:hypothetical protein
MLDQDFQKIQMEDLMEDSNLELKLMESKQRKSLTWLNLFKLFWDLAHQH